MSDLPGADDEAIGRRAYVVKWEAGDQRQRSLARWLQDLNIVRKYHSRGFHLILEVAIECFERDRVTLSNVAQWAEETRRLIEAESGICQIVEGDVSDSSSCQAIVARIKRAGGLVVAYLLLQDLACCHIRRIRHDAVEAVAFPQRREEIGFPRTDAV